MTSQRLAIVALTWAAFNTAYAADANADLGTVTGTQYFTNSPAAGAFNDTYTFSVAAGQSILADVRARNANVMIGTETWSLAFSLTDQQGHLISTGTTDPHATESNLTQPIIGFGGFADTYTGTGLVISASSLSAGQYQLQVSGTKTLGTAVGQEISLSQMYQGELLVYPSGSQANTQTFYAALTGPQSPTGAIMPTITAVPEPSAAWLLSLGLGALTLATRRQRGN